MLNMTTMVKSNATKVTGEINGTNLSWNQASPFHFIREYLLIIPAAKGIPRYMPTLRAMAPMVICTAVPFKPNKGGNTVIKMYAYTLYSSTWKILFNAIRPAAYSRLPSASSFHTTTMAIQRASPISIRPVMYAG